MDRRGDRRDRRGAGLRWPWRGISLRTALLTAFAVLLALWLAAGSDMTGELADVERASAEIDRRYTRAEDLLLAVRLQVLLSSVYVRDALVDATPVTLREMRERVRAARAIVDSGLADYPLDEGSSDERESLLRLEAEVSEYWATLDEVMDAADSQSADEARARLQGALLPRYDVLSEISDVIQVLNRGAFAQQQAELGQTYRLVQRRLWSRLGLVLLLGMGIAWAVIGYAGRLENRLRVQLERDAANTRDLQRLSAKLVQAQEDERRTIARELHDEIGQALTAIKMELGAAERAAASSSDTRSAIDGARAIADRSLQSVRDLTHALHPAMLDDLGLAATVEWYVRQFSARSGLPTELEQDKGVETRLAHAIEICAYRIIQEGLTNVARHAQARRCRVSLQRLPGSLLITVEDDGRGFDRRRPSGSGPPRGLGLLGIQERVTDLRGSFSVETLPGHGTRLTVELPALEEDLPVETDAADPASDASVVQEQ